MRTVKFRSIATALFVPLLAAACATPPAQVAKVETKAAAAAKPAAATDSGKAQVAAKAEPAAAPAPPPLPPAVRQQFEQARAALAAGRLEDAERGFEQLTKAQPDFGAAHANLGLVYRRAGKFEPAVARLEQAVALSPDNAVVYNELGIAYREVGQFAKARDAYEKALALDGSFAAAQLNLGILFDIYLWDGAAALAAYERYLLLAGNDEKVGKWIVELRNRRPGQAMASRKETR